MRMNRIVAVAAIFGFPSLSSAQDLQQLAYYSAYISPRDMKNSSGAPIRDLGGVIQQDRANYHRFGIRDEQDMADPLFANRDLRARIPALLKAAGPGRGEMDAMAERGQPFLVNVFVCGEGARPSIIYLAGAGEDSSGCY